MYGYPASIVIRRLLDERTSAAPAPRTSSTTNRASHWLAAVLVAPIVLAAVVAAVLFTGAPSQGASASGVAQAHQIRCPQTTRWSGCTPWLVTYRQIAGKRILLYGGPYLAKRP